MGKGTDNTARHPMDNHKRTFIVSALRTLLWPAVITVLTCLLTPTTEHGQPLVARDAEKDSDFRSFTYVRLESYVAPVIPEGLRHANLKRWMTLVLAPLAYYACLRVSCYGLFLLLGYWREPFPPPDYSPRDWQKRIRGEPWSKLMSVNDVLDASTMRLESVTTDEVPDTSADKGGPCGPATAPLDSYPRRLHTALIRMWIPLSSFAMFVSLMSCLVLAGSFGLHRMPVPMHGFELVFALSLWLPLAMVAGLSLRGWLADGTDFHAGVLFRLMYVFLAGLVVCGVHLINTERAVHADVVEQKAALPYCEGFLFVALAVRRVLLCHLYDEWPLQLMVVATFCYSLYVRPRDLPVEAADHLHDE